MKQKPSYLPKKYKYSARSGNLKAEAVGVVKGEKHFPVFEGDVVFKPLTKSKPLSTPLFAYAEVFWSWVIDAYFMPAPQYQLAFCEGYEAEVEKYYDYGTVSPMIYGEGEHLLNLLEFFRKYPDDKVILMTTSITARCSTTTPKSSNPTISRPTRRWRRSWYCRFSFRF